MIFLSCLYIHLNRFKKKLFCIEFCLCCWARTIGHWTMLCFFLSAYGLHLIEFSMPQWYKIVLFTTKINVWIINWHAIFMPFCIEKYWFSFDRWTFLVYEFICFFSEIILFYIFAYLKRLTVFSWLILRQPLPQNIYTCMLHILSDPIKYCITSCADQFGFICDFTLFVLTYSILRVGFT